MARDFYETTIALPDATGALKALSGVKVHVVPRGSQDLAGALIDIYQASTGVTKGPDPNAGATGTNPFTTGASGSVRFWAEAPREIDIVFEDTALPARIADRIGWNALPAKSGEIPTSFLKEDGGITQKMLSAAVVYQQVPIGGVMEWWRPAANPVVPPPPGFEVAMGQAITQHDYPIAGAITLPNLQNCFILGATTAKADGTGADANNTAGGAPGIRGTGGSNAGKDLRHAHAVPGVDHLHGTAGLYNGSLYVADHGHGFSAQSGDNTRNAGTRGPGGSGEGLAFSAHSHFVTGTAGGATSSLSVIGATQQSDRPLDTATSTTVWSVTAAGMNQPTFDTDFRPYFYGLLRLIKVRRAA